MTVATTTAAASYLGDGSTTAFAVPFEFFDAAELVVALISATGTVTTQTLGTAYTVSGGAGNIGTVTMTTAPASGTTLHIRRSTARTQTTALAVAGAFPTAAIETRLDRIALQLQELDRADTLAVRGPDTDTTMGRLPARATRAGRYMAFDSLGDPTAAALTTTSVPLVSGWLDVKAGGYVRADGVTDDTTGWRNAAATGLPLYFSGGTTVITGAITLTATGQRILGHPERSIVAAAGNFDTFVFSGGAIGQGMTGIRFSSGSKTGGADIKLDNCFRFEGRDLKHYSTWTAVTFLAGNGHIFEDCLATGFRGPRAWHFYGTNSARAGGTDFFIMRAGPDAANPGGISLEIDGNVASVGLWGFYCNGQAAGASVMTHGIKVHNAVGATVKPRFVVGKNIQVEFAKEEGIRIDAVDDLRFSLVYASAGFKEGVYIGADAEKVEIGGLYASVNGRHGIYIAGRDINVSGGLILGNSYAPFADNRGQFDGVHCAGTAIDVVVSGVRIGDAGSLTQRYGVYGASGATRITVVGCNLADNILAGARDDTGLTAGNMDVLGCTGIASSFEAETVIGAQQGFRGRLSCTVTAGVITAVSIDDAGYHYDAAPTVFVYDPAFTGSGASITVTVANGKITGTTIVSGGSGYSSGAFPYLRPATSGGAVRALNSSLVSANLGLRAQGAGRVQLGSENGIGLDVNASASAVNRLQVTGAATGGEVIVAAIGDDTNIGLALLPKGTSHLRLSGPTDASAGAVALYLEIKVGGTTYKLPLHAV